MINKILVYFNQLTKAEYDAKLTNGELSSKSIVFVNEPRMIYTHGKEYDGRQLENSDITGDLQGLLNAIERLDGRVSALEGDTLQDINITNLRDGDILIYDDTQSKWVNAPSGNFVTLDTAQEITGTKTFKDVIKIKNDDNDNQVVNISYDGSSTSIDSDLYADEFIKSGDTWLNGHDKNDYILLAGGEVMLIQDILDLINPPATTFTVNIECVNKGTVVGETRRTVQYGGSVEIQFQPYQNNSLTNIYKNGTAIIPLQNPYVVSNITSNLTIQAIFTNNPTETTTQQVSIACGQGGSIAAAGTTIASGQTKSISVNDGSSLTLTFTPNTGKVIDTVKVNNQAVTVTGNTYTIPSISADTTVVVTWKDQQVTPTTYTVRYGFAGDSITNIDNIPQNISVTQQSFKTESYTSTATSTGQYWYIAIPTSWTEPTVQYKRGLGPLTIERVNTDNTQYNVYRVTTPHIAGEYTFIIR